MVRVLFAGTPEAAVPSLQALLASEHEVAAVLTRADAPAGRGKRLTPSPVRVAAEAAGIPVITGNPSTEETQTQIADLNCQAAAVVAYGHLLRPAPLALMPEGWFNLHFSRLPDWRGAAPVQWALINGEAEVGVSVFRLDAGMDTGPVFAQQTFPAGPEETTGTLLPKLAELGADLLVKVFDDLVAGSAKGTPQAGTASFAPKITTEQAQVNWHRPNVEVANLIRGVTPAPGAWTTLTNPGVEPVRLGIGPVTLPTGTYINRSDIKIDLGPQANLQPGQILVQKRAVWVGTADGPVQLGILQAPGKKPMPATDWARGARLTEDSRLQ